MAASVPGHGAAPSSSTAGRPGLRLPDAHAHPQDDREHAEAMLSLQASCVAVMGVKEEDWENVMRLKALAPHKVIPCFGVHPWFAHLHATACNKDASGAVSMAPVLDVPPKQDPEGVQWLLQLQPSQTWEHKLRQLLLQHPKAVVGEFGLDRAAVVPGTKASITLEHQMALVTTHIRLAAELGRPVSMHCVRAQGAMHDLLSTTPPDQLPQRIMLHSYGGSPESVTQLTRLPGGVGKRLYFSFSAAINARDAGAQDRLIKRMAAVPDDRLLIESDQNTPTAIDAGLSYILSLVAQAKGWDEDHAARTAVKNFEAFYDGFLPDGYSP